MTKSRLGRPYVAAIIERHDNHILIARLSKGDPDDRLWCFPRGRAKGGESPEAAMRRVTKEEIGIEVEIVVGQPPLVQDIAGERVEVRYFFCGVVAGSEQAGPYEALRWVPKHHLAEYEFDGPSKPVAEWVLGTEA